jgi:type IV pilus assembly protein PilM
MFRKNNIIAVDIGASKLVVAQFQVDGTSGIELVNYGITRYGVDASEQGDSSAYIVSGLRSLMQERGMRGGTTYLCISGQAVFPRFVKLPPVSGDKILQIVRYEAEQNVPFPIEEVVWDYQLIEGEEGEQNVMLVAVKTENITRITDCLVAADMEPELVDVAPMALYNTVRYSYPDLEGCTMVLDIGAKSSNLIFIEGNRIFSRSIPVAGNTITQEIAKEFEVSFREAEDLKLEHAFVGFGGVYAGPETEVGEKVSKITRNVITRLHAEVNRSINFYRSQQRGSPPQLVLLAGGTSVIPHLDTFFQEKLNAQVDFLNPFANVPVSESLTTEEVQGDMHTLGEATGIALRSALSCPVEINLMPPELVSRKTMRRRQPFFILSAAGIVLIMLCWWVYFHQMQKILTKLSGTVDDKIGGLEETHNTLNNVLEERQQIESRIQELTSLISRRTDWLDVLAGLQDSMYRGMWIRQIKPLEDGGKVTHVRVTAAAFQDRLEEVSRQSESTAMEIYRDRLKEKESFTDAVRITAMPPAQIPGVVEFTLKAELSAPIEVK